MNTPRNLIATLAVAAGLVLGLTAPAGATAPAARRYVATFKVRYDADFNSHDEMDVRVYGADGRSWITYLCAKPVELLTLTAVGWDTTWKSQGASCVSAAPRSGLPHRAFEATMRTDYVTGLQLLFVKVAGFLPAPATTYRYRCAMPIETGTSYPDGVSSNTSWVAVALCPVS